MRILVVSNFYPPYSIGGYEMACYEVVEGLKSCGHQVKVLTSYYGLSQPEADSQVYRCLWTNIGLDRSVSRLFKREFHNRREFKKLIKNFQPDLIYFWNLWQVSMTMTFMANRMKLPVSYYIFDNWLSQWGEIDEWFTWWDYLPRHPIKRVGKQLGKQLFDFIGINTKARLPGYWHVQFASHYLKEQALRTGKPVESAEVIYWGLKLEHFPYRQQVSFPIRHLLYVGQLVPHKGVHTAIEAFNLLLQQSGRQDLELTIVGGTILPDYEVQLKQMTSSLGLKEKIHFTGPLPRSELSQIYQRHDILIVPSTWDEPFGLILLEGMASGLAVAGTATGGSAEILQHEVNGLVFPKEDAQACASCLNRLLQQPDLFEQLRWRGRQTVEKQFQIERTITAIEQSLQASLSHSQKYEPVLT